MQVLETSTDKFAPNSQDIDFGQVIDAQEKFEEKKTLDHHKNTPDNLNRLHQSSQNSSLNSMEGLEDETTKKSFDLKTLLRDKVPEFGLGIASAMHLVAGFAKATQTMPQGITEFFNKHALTASKAANLWNYIAKGATALLHGRSWDGIGRLAYIIPTFASLNNFFLFSGISSGITMMEQGHMDKAKTKEFEDKDGENIFQKLIRLPGHLIEDFSINTKAFFEKIQQVKETGLGKDRIVLRKREVEEKHKGTMFVSAFGNFFGAVLGMISPSKDSKLRKIAAIVRNLGGLGCDWGKFTHPDPNNRYSAIAYLGVSALDVVQTFTPEPFATVLSHFGLTINNLANYFYVNTSKARDENKFKDTASLAMAA